MIRHDPSWFFLDHGDATPDPGCHRSVSAAAKSFQLGNKRSPREGIAFLMLPGPLLIGLPEIGRTAPGAGMQLTARGEKLLERIVLGI